MLIKMILLILLQLNTITLCESITTVVDLTVHLLNLTLIFFLVFNIFFNKYFFKTFLIFINKYIKVISVIIYVFFSKVALNSSIFSFSKKSLSKKELRKKLRKELRNKKILSYLKSLKKNSTVLKSIRTLIKIKKVLKRQNFIEKEKKKDLVINKNKKVYNYVYRNWWDFFITGKIVPKTPFYLNKEIPLLEKNINKKKKLLRNTSIKYNLNYREKIKASYIRSLKKIEFDIFKKFDKVYAGKINHLNDLYKPNLTKKLGENFIKRNTLIKNKILKNKINTLNVNIQTQLKNLKSVIKEKERRSIAFKWFRDYFLKNRFLKKNLYKPKDKPKWKWVMPVHAQMKHNILEHLKYYYVVFLFLFSPILQPLDFFYSNHKYPIVMLMVFISLLYLYNRKFRNFIEKHDTKIINLPQPYFLVSFEPGSPEEIEQGATRLAWFWILYMIGVYFWYLTMTPDVTEKVLYGTAVFVILFSLMIYHRYYKVPSKYK